MQRSISRSTANEVDCSIRVRRDVVGHWRACRREGAHELLGVPIRYIRYGSADSLAAPSIRVVVLIALAFTASSDMGAAKVLPCFQAVTLDA